MKKVYVIHENSEWTIPLFQRFEEIGVPYEEWHLSSGNINLSEEPPDGIFYNRMSASSHTRGHRFAPEYTGAVLAWLESWGRKVFNNSRALQLELSKVTQYSALKAFNIPVPRTAAAVGKEDILAASKAFQGAFITKHNRAGKGLGVQLFQQQEALSSYLNSPQFEDSVDGITLIQDYIQSAEPYIIRCEFIGGKFLYAVKVDTSEGFELCPADACQIGDTFCPVGEDPSPKFQIIKDFNHPLLPKYEQFLQANGITFAGIEMIEDRDGNAYTYDVNTNTNYNPDAEDAAGTFGMLEIARFLAKELN
ncbi:RimK family alpha-L-glutamate ligase [Fictibacillus aquaticus]|uniref:Alpha-L-glutamate ligase n=1 Tax=Fictibacillus aquaticus TaxID=2021314 RepID=A0A235FF33_9BACL|nr:alpha-L-glutamate ligase [Fictibacillus aquaticus]OYD59603.1 alpha-L-glutamate ligase [Fictibacillus aquaticus]